jgi:hypothetical protein
LNSEEFRETFLRNDREGPTKAKDGGKEGSQAEGGSERPKGEV